MNYALSDFSQFSLTNILLLGFNGFMLIRLLLTGVIPERWQNSKPWGCPTCLAGWYAVILSAITLFARDAHFETLGPFAVGGVTLLCFSIFSFAFPRLPNG